jgi:hypothetical protein
VSEDNRTCATCHAILAVGPQPAATYEALPRSGSDQEYLFEYYFEGDCYGLTVVAGSIEEACRKVRRMSSAEYKGEITATIALRSPRWLRWLTIRTIAGGLLFLAAFFFAGRASVLDWGWTTATIEFNDR